MGNKSDPYPDHIATNPNKEQRRVDLGPNSNRKGDHQGQRALQDAPAFTHQSPIHISLECGLNRLKMGLIGIIQIFIAAMLPNFILLIEISHVQSLR